MKHPRRKIFVLMILLLLGGVTATYFFWPNPKTDTQPVEKIDPGLDEEYRRLVIGIWYDDYKGSRQLEVRDDGTATMVVEPSGLNAIFASCLTFDEEWTIEAGHFRLTALGGTPKAKVDFILKTMGSESDHKILELTENRMLLLDANGKTQYDWRRIKKFNKL